MFLISPKWFLLQETSLELVTVGDDGVLQSICEQDMFGIVKDIGVLQWHSRHVGLIPQVLYFLTPNPITFVNVLLHASLSLIGFDSEGLIILLIFSVRTQRSSGCAFRFRKAFPSLLLSSDA